MLRILLDAKNTDGGGPSSSSQDDKGADSSQQQQDDNQQQVDQGDAESQVADGASAEDDSAASEDTTGEVDGQQKDQQGDDKGVQAEDNSDDAANVVLDKPEDKDLPFHKHARFQEVIAQKNEVAQKFEAARPLIEQATALQDLLRQNNISPQEYQGALQYLIALRNDPKAAFAMLKPTYDQLAQFNGDVLPAELQAEVSAGTLSLERAKQLASIEAQQRFQQVKSQWQQNGQQQQNGDVIGSTIGLWVNTKKTNDPDLKEGTPLWEQVNLRIGAMPRFGNANDAMQGCEKAYEAAKKFLGSMQPKKPIATKKVGLQSNQTATGNNFVVKSPEDVARLVAKGVKPNQMRYA